MGSSREGYNLFNKYGRRVLFRNLLRGRVDWHYVWTDTFGRYICRVIGHSKTFETDDIPPKKCCLRCFRYI